MKPSQLAKQLGFRTLNELADIADVTPRTLVNWSVSNPERYLAIMLGAAAVKHSYMAMKIIRSPQ